MSILRSPFPLPFILVNLKNSLIATKFLNSFFYHSISSGSWTMKSFTTILAFLTSSAVASPIAEPASKLEERNLQACPSGGNLPAGALYPSLSVLVSQKLPDVPFGSVSDPILRSKVHFWNLCTSTSQLLLTNHR